MKPYSNQRFGPTVLPYTIGVTGNNLFMDQKISVHKLRPGYHTTVYIVPQILETTHDFDNLGLDTRQCKLPHETTGFRLFQHYTQKGCEIECAAKRAASFCQCLPWHYPNNFTYLPMCDMFGGFCFNQIMSNEVYYKACKWECQEDCKETSLSIWQTTYPFNIEELCRDGTYFAKFFKKHFQSIFAFKHYKALIQGQSIRDLKISLSNGSACIDYIRKYVSFVSVESPTESVFKSQLDKRVYFIDQLGVIGGNLGLCVGMSVLGMCEAVMCLCIIILSIGQDIRRLWKKRSLFSRFKAPETDENPSLDMVVVSSCRNAQSYSDYNGSQENLQELTKLYVSTIPDFCCAFSFRHYLI